MRRRYAYWTVAVLAIAVSGQLGCTADGSSSATAALPVARFDGTYMGKWNSADQGATDTGTITFTVANGVISGSAVPGVMSVGSVSAAGALTGRAIFNGHLNCIGGVLTVVFVGQLTVNSSGSASASGTFTDPSPDPPNCVGSSGPWSATRFP